jgi:flagellar hook-length control protein FliK
MIAVDFGMEAALNSGTPAPAAAAAGARASLGTGGGRTRPAASQPGSFQEELQAACRSSRSSTEPCAAANGRTRVGLKTVDAQHGKVDRATGAGPKPADPSAAAEIASLLLQLLQGAATAGETKVDAAQAPAAEEDDPSEEAASETLGRLIELLKQVASAPNGAAPEADPDTARLAQLLEQFEPQSGAALPASLSGKAHQLLRDLHAHLSGAAWGKTVKEMAAFGTLTAAKPEKNGLSAGAVPLVGENLDVSRSRPAATATAEGRVSATPAPAGSEPKPGAGFSTEASGEAPRLAPEKLETPAALANPGRWPQARDAHEGRSAPETLEAPRASTPLAAASTPHLKETEAAPAAARTTAGVSTAGNAAEGRRGGRAAEALRPSAPAADTPAASIITGEDPSADRSEGRARTGERSPGRDFFGAEAASKNGAPAAETFETPVVDPRSSRLQELGLERASGAAGAGKDKEPVGGTVRTGIFEQIVQRAVAQVRNDQGEIKIHLKPDFLGNVRMQIMTENHQVSVRILTELPAVRDMIDAGIQQLKSELQSQGLHVDRLEVSVSDDLRRHPEHQARQGARLWAETAEGGANADRRAADERLEPIYYRARPGAAGAIDMFA